MNRNSGPVQVHMPRDVTNIPSASGRLPPSLPKDPKPAVSIITTDTWTPSPAPPPVPAKPAFSPDQLRDQIDALVNMTFAKELLTPADKEHLMQTARALSANMVGLPKDSELHESFKQVLGFIQQKEVIQPPAAKPRAPAADLVPAKLTFVTRDMVRVPESGWVLVKNLTPQHIKAMETKQLENLSLTLQMADIRKHNEPPTYIGSLVSDIEHEIAQRPDRSKPAVDSSPKSALVVPESAEDVALRKRFEALQKK